MEDWTEMGEDVYLEYFQLIPMSWWFMKCKKKFTWICSCGLGTTEAALQSCSYKKVFLKYTPNLQENPHAEVWFQ